MEDRDRQRKGAATPGKGKCLTSLSMSGQWLLSGTSTPWDIGERHLFMSEGNISYDQTVSGGACGERCLFRSGFSSLAGPAVITSWNSLSFTLGHALSKDTSEGHSLPLPSFWALLQSLAYRRSPSISAFVVTRRSPCLSLPMCYCAQIPSSRKGPSL